MKYLSTLMSTASGSVGGLTASHNKGGAYFRARTIPTNPNTTAQGLVRTQLGSLSSAWNALTEPQRVSWDLYASNVPMINKLGQSIYLSGQQHFIRSNTARIYAGLSVVELGPAIFNLGTFTPPTLVTWDEAALAIGYTNTDEWANEVGGAMIVQTSKPQSPGRTFFKGPFLFAETTLGAVSPPTSPTNTLPPQVFVAGQKGWARIRICRADGRLSMPIIIGPETITTV
jgi:hypothetical protein